MPVFPGPKYFETILYLCFTEKNQGTTDKVIVKVDTEKTCRKI